MNLTRGSFSIAICLLAACGSASSQKSPSAGTEAAITCKDWKCIEENRNKTINIEGVFREYTPNRTGKGAGHMFWEWELVLSDSHTIPAQAVNKGLDLSPFANKPVTIRGLLFHGTIIGSDEPSHAQSAAGYRIDIESIKGK